MVIGLCPPRKPPREITEGVGKFPGAPLHPSNDCGVAVTYGFFQNLDIGVVFRSVPQDLLQQQRVFDQPASRDVQEAPKVELAAERRLKAALQEVLNSPVLLLLVQKGFGCQLIAAVTFVGVEPR